MPRSNNSNSNDSLNQYFKEEFEKSSKERESRSKERRSKERNATNNWTNLSAVEPNLLSSGTNSPRQFICDVSLTKRIVKEDARLLEVRQSGNKLAEGSFGYATSAEIELQGRSKFSCTAALKVTKLDPRIAVPDLAADTLMEMGAYCRLKGEPCLSTALFMKLTPTERKSVMEHYIISLEKLFFRHIFPELDYHRDHYEDLVKAILFQILTGLNEMHKRHFLHKDLKPANILVGHNGIIFVADYGLSIYNPYEFDVAQPYYPATTPGIFPAEAVADKMFDRKFDSFSAGASMAYLLTGRYHYDFYRDYGDKWVATLQSAGETEIQHKFERRIAQVEADIQAFHPTISPACIEFIRLLLSTNPISRKTASDMLEHPWLNGMTMKKSRSIIQRALGNTVANAVAAARPPTIRNLTAKVKAEVRVTAPNADVASYFPLVPIHKSGTAWKPFVSGDKTTFSDRASLIKYIYDRHARSKREVPLVIIHTVELFDRIIALHPEKTYTSEDRTILISILLSIATKVSHLGHSMDAAITSADIARQHSRPLAEICRREIEIVRDLYGDVLPQPDGLVTLYHNYLSTNIAAGLNVPRIMATRYLFGMFLEVYMNIGTQGHKEVFDLLQTGVECILGAKQFPESDLLKKIQRTIAANFDEAKGGLRLFLMGIAYIQSILGPTGKKLLIDFFGLKGPIDVPASKMIFDNIEYSFATRFPKLSH